jgi:hypothetical protein
MPIDVEPELEIRTVPRSWIVVLAVFCGILAIIAWAASFYTYENTPKIQVVIVPVDLSLTRVESKWVYLLVAPAFMAVISIALAWYALTWDLFVAKAEKRERYFRSEFALVRRIKLRPLFRVVCMGFAATQIVLFCWTISRCLHVLALPQL